MEFTNEYIQRAAAGHISNAFVYHKFGASEEIGTEFTPVSYDNVYVTPTTAQPLEVVSDDNQDSPTGSGASTVIIEGIGPDWGFQTEEVTLNGTTPVPTANPFLRVFRVRVGNSNSYAVPSTVSSHAGTIDVRDLGGGVVWGSVEQLPTTNAGSYGIGTSLIACYSVPKGWEAFLLNREINVKVDKDVDVILFSRENADIIVPPFSPMKSSTVRYGISGTNVRPAKTLGERFVGPCDMGFMARSASDKAEVSIAFDLLLVNVC